uniref:Uncharacterized protein n=1 Tax=Podarcis muralis TaxID=64176 RepID=A0A670JWF9_PODMU
MYKTATPEERQGWEDHGVPLQPTWEGPYQVLCGGLATNLTYLLRQDPLHPAGTAPRQRGELSTSQDSNNNDLLSTWHSNTYVKLISQIARQTTTN